MELTRRRVLAATGLGALAVTVAACGDDPEPPATSSVPGEWRAARDTEATDLLLDPDVRARALATRWDRPELVAALLLEGTVRTVGRTPEARRRAEAALGVLEDAGAASPSLLDTADPEVLEAVARVATRWFEVVDAPEARRGSVTRRESRFVVGLAADDLTGLCELLAGTDDDAALVWRATASAWLDLTVRAAVRRRDGAGVRAGVRAARLLDRTDDDAAVVGSTQAVALDQASAEVPDFVDETVAGDVAETVAARGPDGAADGSDVEEDDLVLLHRLRVGTWFAPVLADLDRFDLLYDDGRLRPTARILGDRRATAQADGVVAVAEARFRDLFDGTLDLRR